MYKKSQADEWAAGVKEEKFLASSTPYNPSDSETWMAVSRVAVIPRGLTALVCTPAQLAAAGTNAVTVRWFFARVCCAP